MPGIEAARPGDPPAPPVLRGVRRARLVPTAVDVPTLEEGTLVDEPDHASLRLDDGRRNLDDVLEERLDLVDRRENAGNGEQRAQVLLLRRDGVPQAADRLLAVERMGLDIPEHRVELMDDAPALRPQILLVEGTWTPRFPPKTASIAAAILEDRSSIFPPGPSFFFTRPPSARKVSLPARTNG